LSQMNPLRSILILFSHSHLGFPSGHVPWRFHTLFRHPNNWWKIQLMKFLLYKDSYLQ
jgi:hypothetical protein